MLKKPSHNHYFYQTNLNQQCKSKIKPKKQPKKTHSHTKLFQQQPKEKTQKQLSGILKQVISFYRFNYLPSFQSDVLERIKEGWRSLQAAVRL
jgi:hypothetical protein